jgi:ATP-binding cassette subfamily F protein uup
MALLSLHEISYSFGDTALLDGASLHIQPGERAALVGRNGAGKSTLLSLIAGENAPDGGNIVWQKGARWAFLPQDVPSHLAGTVRSIVESSARESGHTVESHLVDASLHGLGLDGDADFKTLSGGNQRRVLLARALAQEPDLLLLDEPTNHLDIAAIAWLEEFVLRRSKAVSMAVLFVTHDRAFLQNLATRIVEVDRGKLFSHDCTYAQFLERQAQRFEVEAMQAKEFDTFLAQEEVWVRKGVKARETRNEGRVKRLKELREERSQRRNKGGRAQMSLQTGEKSGRDVAEAIQASFWYKPEQVLVDGLSILVSRGDKLALVGPNGGGKSTLIKLLLGQLQPIDGKIKLGTNLQIAYFDQGKAGLDENKSLRWNVAGDNEYVLINGERRHIVTYLGEWLFPRDRINQPARVLSGGEKSRLLLAKLWTQPANLLVLDEPTNDLDIETLELLEQLLVDFEGTLLLVSHDRAFLNNVATSTLSPDGGAQSGRWSEFVGGYDDMIRQRGYDAPQVLAAPAKPSKPATSTAAKPASTRARRMSWKEKQDLETLPARIEALEAEHTALAAQMSEADFYKQDAAKIAAATEKLAKLEAEQEAAFLRWAELEEMAATAA